MSEAEGNPDEEKIGAFGVGKHTFATAVTVFSLLSRILLHIQRVRGSYSDEWSAMDGFLLEGRR